MNSQDSNDFNLVKSIAKLEIALGEKVLSYLDHQDLSSLFKADQELKTMFEATNIGQVTSIIDDCLPFYQKRSDWKNYLWSFTRKSVGEFKVVQQYFKSFGSVYPSKDVATPLHSVIKSNNAEDLALFLANLPEALINFQEPSLRNESILHYAVIQNLPCMVAALLKDQKVHVGLEDEDEETAYMSAIYRGNIEIFCLFNAAAKDRSDIEVDVSAKMDKTFFEVSAGYDYDNDGYFEPSYAHY